MAALERRDTSGSALFTFIAKWALVNGTQDEWLCNAYSCVKEASPQHRLVFKL
jgi:hypothetical protein